MGQTNLDNPGASDRGRDWRRNRVPFRLEEVRQGSSVGSKGPEIGTEGTLRDAKADVSSAYDTSAHRQAERAGFEPAVRFRPHTAFPVPHLRPLGHLSDAAILNSTAPDHLNKIQPKPSRGTLFGFQG